MGTRGAVGFRINQQDKITYNHFDSYPDWLGKKVLEFISNNKISDIENAALNIQLIDTDIEPTDIQIEECKPWTDLGVSYQKTSDWYCLLRKAQGNLQSYIDGLKYMSDNHEFLYDSLFCEYAYIINLDNMNLEFYCGFNKKQRNDCGRYANFTSEDKNGYYGVALVWEIPLQETTVDNINDMIEEMDNKANKFDED